MSAERQEFDEQPSEAVTNESGESPGILDRLGSSKIGRAVVAAAAIGGAGALVNEASDHLQDPPAHYVTMGADFNHGSKENLASHNEQLSPALEVGLHKFFPSLDLSKIQIDKVQKDGGYSYVFKDETGRVGVSAVSAHGTHVGLASAFEFDNGAINIGDEHDELLTMQGVSDGLQSIPPPTK